mgnify:CR=1 FL=1
MQLNLTMKKQLISTFKNVEPLKSMGENIKRARVSRGFSVTFIAYYAGISRSLLYKIENGNPSVAIGAIFAVLMQLGLEKDFSLIGYREGIGKSHRISDQNQDYRCAMDRNKKRRSE